MRLLHTSDWHLGHRFHGRQRHEEQAALLDWLAALIEERAIDTLLVAGDIFDTTTPGSRAQGLYYRFLHRLAASRCRHVVLIAGNHDSPALLEAPRELLRAFDIHVVGTADDNPEKEVLLLRDPDGLPELMVGAVPFLRDRDLRLSAAGQSLEDKDRLLREAVRSHYAKVCEAAEAIRGQTDPDLPLVVMGHLFVAGGRTREGDGVRDLAVGGLGRIEGGAFPRGIDYLALGHLHIGQLVAGSATRRYCGAPLAMSFAEAGQVKEVVLVECRGRELTPTPVSVPIFQPLASLAGDLGGLLAGIERLKSEMSTAWVELQYQGSELIPDLREQLAAAAEGSELAILRIRSNLVYDAVLRQARAAESLDELSVEEVFERRLTSAGIDAQDRPELRAALAEILAAVHGEAGDREDGP